MNEILKDFNNKINEYNKQQNCICNLQDEEEKHIAEGNWCDIYMRKDSDNKYYITAWGEDRADLQINYCPKCGRKLTE